MLLIKKVFSLTAEYAEILKKELSKEQDVSKYSQIYDANWMEFHREKKKLIDDYLY
jgi:hypothetical protein